MELQRPRNQAATFAQWARSGAALRLHAPSEIVLRGPRIRFGIVTTWEEWRIGWLCDADQSAAHGSPFTVELNETSSGDKILAALAASSGNRKSATTLLQEREVGGRR